MNAIPAGHVHGPGWYEIAVMGHLSPRWAARFAGLVLTNRDDGTTVIAGPVADQAALHGLLGTLRDLGLPLVSLTQVDTKSDPNTNPDLGRPDGTPGHTTEGS